MTVSEQLLIAADLIEERGHAKRKCVDSTGAVCLAQAINLAGGMDEDGAWGSHDRAAEMFARSLGAPRMDGGYVPYISICDFNNLSTTNKDVAVAKLREVAEALVSVSA